MSRALPHFAVGEVIKGFGRGSKELGIPTANYPLDVVNGLPESFDTGVYFGWAKVEGSLVYKMVMSIGWNPFYKNKEKSMETHVMHTFDDDFYGKQLKIAIVGFIRPQRNFSSVKELIDAIRGDIQEADKRLEEPEYQEIKNNAFF